MATKKHIRDTKELLTECGVDVTTVEISRKHLKFFVQIGSHKHLFVRSATPSDGRSEMNFKGDVRRWINEVKGNKK